MGRRKRRKARARKRATNEVEALKTQGQVAGAYQAYRPYNQQALEAAMYQSMAAYQPANQMMAMLGLPTQGGAMYGSPVSPMMMQVGAPSQAPGYAYPQQPQQTQPPAQGAVRKGRRGGR